MKTRKQIMKMITAVCLVAALAFTFCAPVNAASRGYSFKYKGVSVSVGSNASSFIKKAGKPTKTVRKKSCAYKGEDVTYTYKYFTLKTYSNTKGGTEYVNSITLTSSKVSTPEKVKVGSSEKTVTKKYGKAKANFGVYTYTKGNSKLIITVDNKKVSQIQYVAK